jgi:predicted RecA/RadA family phage recombinase
MLEFTLRTGGQTLPYTPSGAKTAGEVVLHPAGFAGAVVTDLADGQLGAVTYKATGDLKAATGTTFAAGDLIFWDVSDNVAIAEGSAVTGDFPVGTALAAKISGPLFVSVTLNEQPIS